MRPDGADVATPSFRLACIVLAHRGPAAVTRLVARLAHPHVRVYLHLDARADARPFRDALSGASAGAPTWLLRRPTRWGGIEIVDAAIDGLARGLRDGCDYFVLLSGQDQPAWPIQEVVDFFRKRADRTYMEYFSLPDSRWRHGGRLRTDCYTYTVRGRRETHVPGHLVVPMSWKGRVLNLLLGLRTLGKPPRAFPPYVRPFGGSQWWNMDRTAARYVIEFLNDHPGYRRYHQHTLLPDEIFFQSILLGTDFPGREDVVNDPLRYMVWEQDASHPRVLGVSDLPAMAASGQPFARKFDEEVDQEVIDRLPLGGTERRDLARAGVVS